MQMAPDEIEQAEALVASFSFYGYEALINHYIVYSSDSELNRGINMPKKKAKNETPRRRKNDDRD